MLAGCNAFPDVLHQPQYHNPFPQLHRVAILPFYNLSADPTVDQDAVALVYYQQLQQIPGFEVMPPGVVKQYLLSHNIVIDASTDFQQLARQLGVDALIRGAITDYTPYYPPRFGISVDWFAANPSFHPVPPGYGLPWGTSQEEFIPSDLVLEAEFALAREQLRTQTPDLPSAGDLDRVQRASAVQPGGAPGQDAPPANQPAAEPPSVLTNPSGDPSLGELPPPPLADLPPDQPNLPPDWPDPRGFVPPPPQAERPLPLPQSGPIISHTRLYDGSDGRFTEKLADYVQFRDDARFGGWQGYLQRSDDFISFCCFLHITETLAARGGAGETRVVYRWPFGRYQP